MSKTGLIEIEIRDHHIRPAIEKAGWALAYKEAIVAEGTRA